MGAGKATGWPQYLFYALNTLFLCAGIVLLAVGVEYKWFLDDFYVVHPDQQYYLNLAPSGMIVIGASISFMAVFGYWAARVENNCMLTMYFMMLLTIFISQIVLGSMGIVQMRNSDGVLGERINGTTFEYFGKYHTDEDARKRIDYYQYQIGKVACEGKVSFSQAISHLGAQHHHIIKGFLQCCGADGPRWWTDKIPKTCCSCNCEACTVDAAFRDGCNERILYAFQKCVRVVGGVFIGLTVFDILSMISSCQLIALISGKRKLYGMALEE